MDSNRYRLPAFLFIMLYLKKLQSVRKNWQIVKYKGLRAECYSAANPFTVNCVAVQGARRECWLLNRIIKQMASCGYPPRCMQTAGISRRWNGVWYVRRNTTSCKRVQGDRSYPIGVNYSKVHGDPPYSDHSSVTVAPDGNYCSEDATTSDTWYLITNHPTDVSLLTWTIVLWCY